MSYAQGVARLSGAATLIPIRRHGFYAKGMPEGLPLRYRLRGLYLEACLRLRLFFTGAWRGLRGTGVIGVGRLYASIIRANGQIEHQGLLSTKVITTAGVTFLRDDWNGGANHFALFNFHGVGTGAVAENITDTALGAESTTALNPDSTRATGSKTVPTANTFQTVGTLTFDGAASITEHGLFSTSGTGTGTLWDRSVFGVLTMASGDSIQVTYVGTLSQGG